MKRIAILGITGSIGTSACDVIREHPDHFQIVFASAHSNQEKLLQLQHEFSIPTVVLSKNNEQSVEKKDHFYVGETNLHSILGSLDCDIILNAISGSAGLPYSMLACERNIRLALANKESMVMAGHLMNQFVEKEKVEIIPVDSEHSALFQAIGTQSEKSVRKLILTASGGPFRTIPLADFERISVQESLNHPNWEMGRKITIDSATMMNKGLEVIEAHWLFNKPYNQIEAVIHPQSVIHSFVEFIDGSILAQMSLPTMYLPILYAFSFPERIQSTLSQTNILQLSDLTFEPIVATRYPLFFLAVEAGKAGGIMPTIINAANEAAVDLFLQQKIAFNDIFKLVDKTVQTAENIKFPTMDTILQTNKDVYLRVLNSYSSMLL